MKKERILTLYEALVIWIGFTSITSVILLTLNKFNSSTSLLLSTTTYVIFIKAFRISFNIDIKIDFFVLAIIVISLTLRIKPYLYIMGGQDEGVYVNMSSYYQNYGSTFITDNLRSTLTGETLKYYDSTNQYRSNTHQPGLYIKDLDKSEYVFQFYPLHPLWMAIFKGVLGFNNGIYSLTFFSILSIINLFLITNQLVKNSKIPGYLIALLIALNPLHLFFSKFPVSEVVSLFFSSSGFYFLIKYFKNTKNGYLNLALSSLCFLSLFLNHVSGLMYLPWFFAITITTLIISNNRLIKKQIVTYFITIIFSLVVSTLYCYFYSPPYFNGVFKHALSMLSSNINPQLIYPATIISSLIILFIYRYKGTMQEKIFYLFKFIPIVTIAIIVLSFHKAYLLGYTNSFQNHSIQTRWNLSGLGTASLSATSIFVFISYTTIPVFLLFILLLIKQIFTKINYWYLAFLLFLTNFFVFRLFLSPFIPYQFYFVRYLIPELVPYTLIFTITYSWKHFQRKPFLISIYAIFFLLVGYSYYSHSKFQNQGEVGNGAPQALNQIKEVVHNNLLLLYSTNFQFYTQINTPLSYYYDIPVFSFNSFDKLSLITNSLKTKFTLPYYLLSQEPIEDPVLEPIKIIFYSQGRYEHSNKIPTKFETIGNFDLYLYEFQNLIEPDYIFKKLRKINLSSPNLEIQNTHTDGIWTDGNTKLNNINFPIVKEDKYIVLKTFGFNPFINKPNKLNVNIVINNQLSLVLDHVDNNILYFKIPPNTQNINTLLIKNDTFNPSVILNNSQDDRNLGLDIKSISVE